MAQLIGMAAASKLTAKEIEQKTKELELREQYVMGQQQQIAQYQSQIDSALVGIVRNSYTQCLNWAIDLNPGGSVFDLVYRANELYEALEARVTEIAETRKADALERIRIANEKAGQERKEKEEKPAE